MTFDPSREARHYDEISAAPVIRSQRKRQAEAAPTCVYPAYDENGEYTRDSARYEVERIKGEIEELIHWKRSGIISESGEQRSIERETQLATALAAWKVQWSAKDVDVETILHDVFTSPAGRVWENDPDVKRLARVWAGVEQS